MSKVLLRGLGQAYTSRSRGVPGVDEEGNLTPEPEVSEPVIDEPGEYKVSTADDGTQTVTTFEESTQSNVITTIDPEGEVVSVERESLVEETPEQTALITAATYDETFDLISDLAPLAPLAGLTLLALFL